jgi:Chalcone isomerase-like
MMCGLVSPGRAEPSSTVCRDGFCFAAQEEFNGLSLPLRGVSTFRYWGFRVYTGALYTLPSATSTASVLGEVPKKLILRYHRSLSVDQFVEKSEETLGDNPHLSLEGLQPFLSRMNSLYVPVRKGDSYAITYDPTKTTIRLFFNDQLLGEITDRHFAGAYFGIWLSDHSVGEGFTNELLGIKR